MVCGSPGVGPGSDTAGLGVTTVGAGEGCSRSSHVEVEVVRAIALPNWLNMASSTPSTTSTSEGGRGAGRGLGGGQGAVTRSV